MKLDDPVIWTSGLQSHPGVAHVHHEGGQPAVLGDTGIGSGDAEPPIGAVGERGPDLLAGEHPFLAVTNRPGPQPGEVGAGVGLGEQLTPHLVAAQQGWQKPVALLVAPVDEYRRTAPPSPTAERIAGQIEPGLLLVEDDRFDEPGTAAPVSGRPSDPCPTLARL